MWFVSVSWELTSALGRLPRLCGRADPYAACGHGGGACNTVRNKAEAAYARSDPAPLALDEEPDHGFPAAPGVTHRDQAAVGRGLVGIGPDVVALRRQPG